MLLYKLLLFAAQLLLLFISSECFVGNLKPYYCKSNAGTAIHLSRLQDENYKVFKSFSHLHFINLSQFVVTRRYEGCDKKICHIEIRKRVRFSSVLYLFPMLKPKPIAKAGYRSFSSHSTGMDRKLNLIYNDTNVNIPVALFVYMWVDPSFRGQGLGDFLLDSVKNECVKRGESYMLIVHDDNGSGKLISFYEDRGFYPVFDLLDKGMICKF